VYAIILSLYILKPQISQIPKIFRFANRLSKPEKSETQTYKHARSVFTYTERFYHSPRSNQSV